MSLCRKSDLNEFAKAKIVYVRETTFGKLTKEDKAGHEEFSSDEEMYRTYSQYYKFNITPKTHLKIVKFRLIS